MSEATKTCNLTEDEIQALIANHGMALNDRLENTDAHVERINYLNKRLKAFKEVEINKEPEAPSDAQTTKGWT